MSGSSSRFDRSAARSISQQDVDNFDWAAYEGSYKGRALITRLSHIPRFLLASNRPRSPSSLFFARTALLRLIPQIKRQTWDHNLYLASIAQIAETHGRKVSVKPALDDEEDDAMLGVEAFGTDGDESDGVPDWDWVYEARENEKKENGRLMVELTGYMSNLIKESIRLTYLAFAMLSIKCGNAAQALKHYGSAREYCTSPGHHVDLGLAITNVCLSFNLPTNLPSHLSKLEAALDRLHPPHSAPNTARTADASAVTAQDLRENRERDAAAQAARKAVGVKLRVGRGLFSLAGKDYEKAGRDLGEATDDGGLGDWEGQAVSTADLALITAMCVLATGKRSTIRHLLLDRASFRSSVDDSQAWILDAVRGLVNAQYGEVLAIFQKEELSLNLNPFLSPHVPTLLNLIYTRAMVQYVEPFSSVQLADMASAFGTEGSRMLKEVEELVEAGKIAGKIDLIDNVLQVRAADARGDAYANALRVGKATNDMTKAALLRLKLQEANIIVDPRPPDARQGQGQSEPQSHGLGPTDSEELDMEMQLGMQGAMGDVES